ncbi:MAG: hypothetical protein IT304_05235 [Dehalococcoidia bacterium]|nr:hypothetical protein [Dehalococcoidia bacterium]
MRYVVGGLTLAALVELFVLRTFTRTAIHIPALEELAGPYTLLAGLGRYAYYLSVVLLIAALPLLALALWRRRTLTGVVAAVALTAFAAIAAAAGPGAIPEHVADAGTLAAVVTLAGVAAGHQNTRGALVLLLFGAAFALSAVHTTLQAAAQGGLGTIDAHDLLFASEIGGVAFALASPLLVPGACRRRTALAAGAVALVVFGSLLGAGGPTTRILLLWNEGLSGTLPSAIYALAAGALSFTLLHLLGTRRFMTLLGFLLVLAGGVGLHNTYQSGLVVVGLAVLALSGPSLSPALAEDKSP